MKAGHLANIPHLTVHPTHIVALGNHSYGRLAGGLGAQGSAQERESGAKAACSNRYAQTGPGAEDRPTVAVINVCWQAVDKGRVPGQVVGNAGGIRAQGNSTKDPCREKIRTEIMSLDTRDGQTDGRMDGLKNISMYGQITDGWRLDLKGNRNRKDENEGMLINGQIEIKRRKDRYIDR